MACRCYNNNGNCRRCPRFVKSIEIKYEPDVLTIVIPEMVFENHDKICLCLAQAIPSDIKPETLVIVQVGTGNLAKMMMITKWGNYLYADVLRTKKIYPLYAATDTSTLVLQDMCKIGPTEFAFPTVPEEFPSKED